MDKWEKNGDSKVDTKVVLFTKHASVTLSVINTWSLSAKSVVSAEFRHGDVIHNTISVFFVTWYVPPMSSSLKSFPRAPG